MIEKIKCIMKEVLFKKNFRSRLRIRLAQGLEFDPQHLSTELDMRMNACS